MSNIFRPHSDKQESALFSKKKITLLATGIQFGKTTVGAVFTRRLIHEFNTPDDNFIITAPSYKILKQSTLPAFEKVMGGLGRYNGADATYKIKNGPTVYFRTSTHPDSVVGITNVRGVWGDEAGLYSLYFWENLQARASFRNCPIILTTSPYTLNWVFKELIRPTKKGERDDVMLIQAASIENPYWPKEEYYRRQKTMEPRRFRMMYGGDWDRPEGLVYGCFDEYFNTIDPIRLPDGTIYVAGVDWGYNDPFVIKVRAITPDGFHYDVSEFYKTQLTISQMIEVAQQKKQTFNIKRFYCDPSQPAYIAEFNAKGLTAIGANNDIDIGIDRHYELIKSQKYKIFKGCCPHTMDELESYHYPEMADLKPDQNAKEIKPVDQGNHAMDADRYISIMTYKGKLEHTPHAPEEQQKALTQEERLKKLMKKNSDSHTERFSA